MYKHLISFTCRTGATNTHTKAQTKGPPLLRPVNRLRHSSSGRAGPPPNRRCRVSRPCLPGQAAHQAASAGPRREGFRKEDKRRGQDKKKTQTTKDSGRSVLSALCSAGLRPVAPPRCLLHLPSRGFQKALEGGRAPTPTPSRRPSTNRERAAPPLPFSPSASGFRRKHQAGKFRREMSFQAPARTFSAAILRPSPVPRDRCRVVCGGRRS